MSATRPAWLALASPLAGTILIALLWKHLPGRAAGWLGTGALGAVVRVRA